jgi:DNA-binding response OmpR family regulator
MAKRVLVLEDDPTLYELLHELLGFEGYTVSQPADLANVVAEVKATPPDAMLVDVNLKRMNGLELLTKLRNEAELKNVIILLSSGLDYSDESMKRGANGFLQKPYMPDELINLLGQHVK